MIDARFKALLEVNYPSQSTNKQPAWGGFVVDARCKAILEANYSSQSTKRTTGMVDACCKALLEVNYSSRPAAGNGHIIKT